MLSDTNPFLCRDFGTPHSTFPFDKIRYEHYEPAIEAGMNEEMDEIARITACKDEPTFDNTILALEQAGGTLETVTTVMGNFLNALATDELHAIAERQMPRLMEHSNKIMLDRDLFERVRYVWQHADEAHLTDEQRMVVDKHYKSFIRNGALLDDGQKKEFDSITQQLSLLSLSFEQNNLKDQNRYTLHITSRSELAGLPESVLTMAKAKAAEKGLDGWAFTLDAPLYVPFMKYAADRELRREMYMAYNTISAKGDEYDNRETVVRTVNLRLRLANLLGYATYADYVLANRMAGDTRSVYAMLDTLAESYMPLAHDECERVSRLARETDGIDVLMPWDWSYYSERLRRRDYDLDDEETKQYFEIGEVIRGVFGLATRLYGLTFREEKSIPVYHPDVKAFEVFDSDGRYMAVLYTDFYPRATKQSGAWMTEFRPQWKDADGDHRPHVSLVMNFNPPADGKPSLLTHGQVNTFLHEFGHALHGILSDVTYRSISGTNVLRDFVELPSQFMENYSTEPSFLSTFARHYVTGEPMPAGLIDKIKRAENFNTGYACTRQVSFAALDMAWHDLASPFEGNVEEREKEVFDRYAVMPRVDGTMMSTQFGHIFSGGYAAGYYGYKWAEILDADAFSKFKENGIFDHTTAKSFRDNILSRGGAEQPMDLYVRFRGRKPTIEALLKRSGVK